MCVGACGRRACACACGGGGGWRVGRGDEGAAHVFELLLPGLRTHPPTHPTHTPIPPLQVHYLAERPDGDASGVRLTLTDEVRAGRVRVCGAGVLAVAANVDALHTPPLPPHPPLTHRLCPTLLACWPLQQTLTSFPAAPPPPSATAAATRGLSPCKALPSASTPTPWEGVRMRVGGGGGGSGVRSGLAGRSLATRPRPRLLPARSPAPTASRRPLRCAPLPPPPLYQARLLGADLPLQHHPRPGG